MSEKEKKLFDEVFLQYHPILLRFGRKIIDSEYLVEECIQELFLYIYEKKINLQKIGNLRAYLFTAIRRRILLEKNSIQPTTITDIPTDIRFFTDDFQEEKEDRQNKNKQLSHMLNNLAWRQREAIFLKYFNRLSTKEIAEIMGIQPQVVANTIYKALKKMKDIASTLPIMLLLSTI